MLIEDVSQRTDNNVDKLAMDIYEDTNKFVEGKV